MGRFVFRCGTICHAIFFATFMDTLLMPVPAKR